MPNQKDQPFQKFDSFEDFFAQAEQRAGFWEERAKLEFTREVLDRMNQTNISKSELAERLEVQPGLVTRLLSGRNNFELSTMVRIAMALNCRFRSHLQPMGTKTLWFDVLHNEPRHEEVEPWNPTNFRGRELFTPHMRRLNYATSSIAA